MPKDVRTLLHTPRHSVIVSSVEPGEYIHFNLETAIIESISNTSFVILLSELELDFNIDGCALDRAGTVHLWPIQCRVSNLQQAKPIVVGVYKGSKKPNDPNKFFEAFIKDIITIISNGGINLDCNKVPIRLTCFVADAPAPAFILNHRGHVCATMFKVQSTLCLEHYVRVVMSSTE